MCTGFWAVAWAHYPHHLFLLAVRAYVHRHYSPTYWHHATLRMIANPHRTFCTILSRRIMPL
jgi:hypothetical protein